jgi:calreticulin
MKEVAAGSLFEDWDMVPPKTIKVRGCCRCLSCCCARCPSRSSARAPRWPLHRCTPRLRLTLPLASRAHLQDPEATKPEDWDEREKIPDPEDKKPEGYDDIPATIPDKDAKKPDDWNDEDDGALPGRPAARWTAPAHTLPARPAPAPQHCILLPSAPRAQLTSVPRCCLAGEWEPPVIPNPEYKGEWKPKMIDNPAYKGIWVAPDIPNPAYVHDDTLYQYKDLKYVGFELWQVKAGSIFDNIIVTDSLDEAFDLAKSTWEKNKDAEKEMMEKVRGG